MEQPAVIGPAGIVVDTAVVIEAERRRIELRAYLPHYFASEIFISVITVSELLHGAERANNSRRRERRFAYVGQLLDKFVMMPIDLGVGKTHARIWAELEI